MASEKLKSLTLKRHIPCGSIEVYNMLQDLRHVAIIDFRPFEDYSQGFIRDSYNFSISQKDSWLGVIEYLQNIAKKAEEEEKKYETKRIRRIVAIPPAFNEEAIKRHLRL